MIDKISFDNSIIHCYHSGQGKPLLFLHGFGGNYKSFLPVIQYFKKSRAVIAPDILGFGDSTDPESAYSLEDYANSVLAVLEYYKAEKVDIIAHSFGGRIALKMLAKYPDKFDRAILCGCAGLKPRRSPLYYLKILKFKLLKKLKSWGIFKNLDLSKYGSKDYKNLSPVMKESFKKVVGESVKPYLKDIKSPVLLIFGEKDRATPLYMAKTLHKTIEGSGLIVFKSCGHFCYLDKLFDFLKISKTFFEVE